MIKTGDTQQQQKANKNDKVSCKTVYHFILTDNWIDPGRMIKKKKRNVISIVLIV